MIKQRLQQITLIPLKNRKTLLTQLKAIKTSKHKNFIGILANPKIQKRAKLFPYFQWFCYKIYIFYFIDPQQNYYTKCKCSFPIEWAEKPLVYKYISTPSSPQVYFFVDERRRKFSIFPFLHHHILCKRKSCNWMREWR